MVAFSPVEAGAARSARGQKKLSASEIAIRRRTPCSGSNSARRRGGVQARLTAVASDLPAIRCPLIASRASVLRVGESWPALAATRAESPPASAAPVVVRPAATSAHAAALHGEKAAGAALGPWRAERGAAERP